MGTFRIGIVSLLIVNDNIFLHQISNEITQTKKDEPFGSSSLFFRAIDGARTRGLDLGKVARYQLRHYRISSLSVSDLLNIPHLK